MISAHSYANIASVFDPGDMFVAQADPPLTSAQGALVAVSLAGGIVGVFESKLPFREIDKYPLHTMSRPLLILGMLLVGGWQYVRTKRKQDAKQFGNTPWPPDWGPGDASRFADFPELPKSRTQLVQPSKTVKPRGELNRLSVRTQPESVQTERTSHPESGSAEFPELATTRTQLVHEAPKPRGELNRPLVRPRKGEMVSHRGSGSADGDVEEIKDISSAEINAMVFQQMSRHHQK